MTARPRSLRLRTYAVGFGDCLLLTVRYGSALPDGRRERHVLVDCGSLGAARGGPSLAEVAAAVAEHCAGRLDVVVATGAGPEHVSGFGDPEVREILRPLAPAVVVRPWTDGAPDAAPTLLDEWGSAGRRANVRAGDTVDALPRVTMQVLAPPGADGPPGPVRTGSIALADGAPSAPRDDAPSVPVVDAWAVALRTVADPGGVGVAERLIRVLVGRPAAAGLLHVAGRGEESLVLLVTVGNRTVLLPGDAGIASWAPVLDRARGRDGIPKDPRLARQLTDVDVYKVGRGTPGRLRGLWEQRVGSARPLVSVLSALPAGGPGVGPPDDPLVADLGRIGTVHSTGELPPTVWWFDVEAPTSGRAAVTYTPGPVR